VVLRHVQVAIMKQLLHGANALRGNGIIVEFDHYRVVNQEVVALISGVNLINCRKISKLKPKIP